MKISFSSSVGALIFGFALGLILSFALNTAEADIVFFLLLLMLLGLILMSK